MNRMTWLPDDVVWDDDELSRSIGWDENKHPRDPSGKFGHGHGGGGKWIEIDNPSPAQIAVGDQVYHAKKDRWLEVVEVKPNELTVKLPNGFNAPTSNKVDKVRKPAVPSEAKRPKHLDNIDRSLAAFRGAGGTVEHDPSPKRADAELDRVQTHFEMAGKIDDFDDDDGATFAKGAMHAAETTDQTLVMAVDPQLGLAGALSYRETTADDGQHVLYVEYAGSTRVAKGAGTAMAKRVAELAAAKGIGVRGHPADKDAKAFWQSIGWTEQPDGNYGWTPDDAKAVAGL